MNNNKLLLLNVALLTGAASALTPSVQVSWTGPSMRSVAVANSNSCRSYPASQQHKIRCRSNKSSSSSLFYTNGDSSIQDGDGNDVVVNTSSSSTHHSTTPTPPPLPIDLDGRQHDDVLNRIALHTAEQFNSSDFFGEEEGQQLLQQQQQVSAASSPSLPDTRSTTTTPTVNTKTQQETVSETRQIINEVSAIALPSLGGMLLDPIMSLIDTACVGQISTTALAAMAPCTSIFQFVFFAFFFMSAATTNLVASNPPESVYSVHDTAEAARRVDLNERVVSNASLLAVVLGSIVSLSLFKFCDPLLTLAGVEHDHIY